MGVQESACFLCKSWRTAGEEFGPMKQCRFTSVENWHLSLSPSEMQHFSADLCSK